MRRSPAPEESASISPQRFWSEYVLPHKAVVIRNALAGSPAWAHWSDEDYLVSRFGDLEAKLEHRMEARGDSLFGKVTRTGRATIRDIVTEKVDGYVVSVVPQPMAWEVNVPTCILCGKRNRPYLDQSDAFPFITELEETSLWISRGRTRSQLHYDKENTFNCLVTGEPKKWVTLDTRKYGHLLPWVRGGGYNQTNDLDTKYTDWVGIDVDHVDLSLHAYLREVEFQVLTQNPGDCVFVPFSMLHYAGHLVTDNTLQVAISYMWLPETDFNYNCRIVEKKSLPLAVFDTVWFYSGFGAIPQGHHNPRHLADAITPPQTDGSRKFNVFGALSFLPPDASSDDVGLAEVVGLLGVIKDTVNNNVSVPLDVWLQLSTAIDLNGLGCNWNQSYIPRPSGEVRKMFEYLENW